MPNKDSYLAFMGNVASAYTHADISYCVLESSSGRHLLYGQVKLKTDVPPNTLTSFVFKSKRVTAGRHITQLSKGDVQAIIQNAANGQIHVGAETFDLPRENGRLSEYWHRESTPFPARLMVFGLSSYKAPLVEFYDPSIRWELNATETPFESLDALLRHISLPELTHANDLSRIKIEGVVPGRVTAKQVVCGGTSVLSIRVAASLGTEKVRIGYVLSPNESSRTAASVSGRELTWQLAGGFNTTEVEIPTPDDTALHAYLSHSGVQIDACRATDPKQKRNPLCVIHDATDPQLEAIKRLLLQPETKHSETLEHAVSVLMSLLGFVSLHYGQLPVLKDGPDIVVVSEEGKVAVLECTTGHIDKSDKLSKLINRTNSIKKALESKGDGRPDVLPVVVSILSREQLAVDLPTAEKLGIAVIAKEDMPRLVEMLEGPPASDRVFLSLKANVPEAPLTK